MLFRRYAIWIILVIGLAACPFVAHAQQATVLLNASPSVIMADGRSSTTITATVSGLNGGQIADGTIVRFTTTAGSLNAAAVTAVGGLARVTLTSSPVPGYATISASFVGSNGSGNGQYQVEFTGDKDMANTDQGEADWIRVSSNDYLEYSVDSKIVDASGKNRGVKFSYRGLVIQADALQADMATGSVRARNAMLQRGRHTLTVRLLAYNITAGSGQGLSDSIAGARTVEMIGIKGADLSVNTLQRNDFNSSALQFVDISDSRVVVTASAVAVRLNDKIQLKHAAVYVDDKHIVSMPYQIMPLTTTEIFGQQVVGYGTDGLFLDVPYYASVSPKSTGAFYLRSTSAAQQDGTYYNGRQGLALDYVNTYGSFDGKQSGSFNIMGLSRDDWGSSWTHSQQFSSSLRGYFYVDVPEHNSLFASSNVVQQMHGFSLNLTATQTNSPVVSGFSSNEQNIQSYLQTDAHRLNGTASHGLFYSDTISENVSDLKTLVPGSPSEVSRISTTSAGMNFFTTPFKISSKSQLTDSVNFSQAEENGTGSNGVTANAVMNMTTHYNTTTASTFSYDFSHDPVTGNLQNAPVIPGAIKPVSDQSNYSLSFNIAPKNNHWNTIFASTYSMPLGNSSISGGLNYFPATAWELSVNEAYSQYAGIAYSDLEFSIGRRIGSRELMVYWSSLERRLRVNIASAQF
jgi:hypothetical protein